MAENTKNTKGPLKYNPSEKIKELAKMFESQTKLEPGNKKSEESAIKDLDKKSKSLQDLKKSVLELKKNGRNTEDDEKKLEKLVATLNEQTESVIEKMAQNRIERKKGFFGLFRKSNLLNALVDKNICNPTTGKIKNFENFTKLSDTSEIPDLGKSVMTKVLWANIAEGCSLADKIKEAFQTNETIVEYNKIKDETQEKKYPILEKLKNQFASFLNLDVLSKECGFPNNWAYNNESIENLAEIFNKEENKLAPFEKSAKQVIKYHETNLNEIKNELLKDYMNSNLNFEELVVCYFKLVVLRQACQMVVYFKLDSNVRVYNNENNVEEKKT